jgi:hypothetical protein
VYVGLENDDRLAAIDTLANKVIGTVPIGQAAQAVNYVPNTVSRGDGTQGLQMLGVAGQAAHLSLVRVGKAGAAAPTSVSLFDQGLLQVLQAAVTGLDPKAPYVLALSEKSDGGGALEPLSAFTTNPAGAAIVNAIGPIRQIVKGEATDIPRRYLVIVPGTPGDYGAPVQLQAQ